VKAIVRDATSFREYHTMSHLPQGYPIVLRTVYLTSNWKADTSRVNWGVTAMKGHSKNIDLARLATDVKSEVPSMVHELEGISSGSDAPTQRPATRFILAGAKLAFGSKKAGARK